MATPQPGGVNLGEIVVWLRENLPAECRPLQRRRQLRGLDRPFLPRAHRLDGHMAPMSGSMGYGVPAAVAMQRLHPDRIVVCVCGDGDFLMNGQEFATAVQYGLPIVVIVCDNGMYGTIRMHQERDYPERVVGDGASATPDFAAYARAFGGFGATVDNTAAPFPTPSRRRVTADSRRSSISRSIPDAILPGTTLGQIRQAAKARPRPSREPG